MATGLARWLHDLPRLDRGFHTAPSTPPVPVQDAHDPILRDYVEGVVYLVAVPVLVLLVLLLLDICCRAKRCVHRSCSDQNARASRHTTASKATLLRRSKILLLLVIIFSVCVGLLVWGGVSRPNIYTNSANLRYDIDRLSAFYKDVKHGVQECTGIRSGVTLVNYILNSSLIPPDMPNLREEALEFRSKLQEGEQQLTHYMGALNEIDLEQVNSHTSRAEDQTRRYGDAIFALCCVVCVLLLLYYRVHAKRMQDHFYDELQDEDDEGEDGDERSMCSSAFALASDLLVMLSAATVLVVCVVLFVTSTILADVCTAPLNTLVAKEASVWAGPKGAPVALYYIVCNDTSVNPLEQRLDTAIGQLNSSLPYLQELSTYAQVSGDHTLIVLMNQTFNNVTGAEGSLMDVRAMLGCSKPHAVLRHVEHTVCGPVLSNFFILFVLCAFLVLLSMSTRCMLDCACHKPPCCCRGSCCLCCPRELAEQEEEDLGRSGSAATSRSASSYNMRSDYHSLSPYRARALQHSGVEVAAEEEEKFVESAYYQAPQLWDQSALQAQTQAQAQAQMEAQLLARSHVSEVEEEHEVELNSDVPESFLCPISGDVMIDPVIDVKGGFTYERRSIEHWLYTKQECPQTRRSLTAKDLVPNRALKEEIDRWLKSKRQQLRSRRQHGLGSPAASAPVASPPPVASPSSPVSWVKPADAPKL